MSVCEKCWAKAGGDPFIYDDLIVQAAKTGNVCTPEEQAGPTALECPHCHRKTLHLFTNELYCGCSPTEPRTCTCHPDDNPPRPCPQKFALSECRAAAGLCQKHGAHSPGVCPQCDELAEARMILCTVVIPPEKAP